MLDYSFAQPDYLDVAALGKRFGRPAPEIDLWLAHSMYVDKIAKLLLE